MDDDDRGNERLRRTRSGDDRCASALGGPVEEALERPAIDDALGGYSRDPGVSDRRFRIPQLFRRVRIAVQREQASAL